MQKYLLKKAGQLLHLLQAGGYKITFAESCTGGLLAAAFTSCPGASDALQMSFVTYADSAKGAKNRAAADLALAVTGWAGPAGFSEDWPVGQVYIAAAWQEQVQVWRYQFPGGRQLVRQQAALAALQQGLNLLKKPN